MGEGYKALQIIYKSGVVKIYPYDFNGLCDFDVKSGGLVLKNSCGGWIAWINLDSIREIRQLDENETDK